MVQRLSIIALCVIILMVCAGCGIENTTWERFKGKCPDEIEIGKEDDAGKYQVTVYDKNDAIDATMEEAPDDRYRLEFETWFNRYIFDIEVENDALIMREKKKSGNDGDACIMKPKEEDQ